MATTVSDVAIARDGREFVARAPRSLWSDARRRLLRNKASVAGLIFIGILLIVALTAPLLTKHNAIEIFPGQSYRQAAWIHTNNPSSTGTWEFPLGTDSVGRD